MAKNTSSRYTSTLILSVDRKMKTDTLEARNSAFELGEIGQIVLAWVALSLAISITYIASGDIAAIVASFIASATAFICHEMGHEFGLRGKFSHLGARNRPDSDHRRHLAGSVHLRCAGRSLHRARGWSRFVRICNGSIAQRG